MITDLTAFIRRRQRELGVGQNELARACGLSHGTLANLLAGRVSRSPSLNTLHGLAIGLGVSPDYLLSLILGDAPDAIRADSAEGPGLAASELRILEEAAQIGISWDYASDPVLVALSPRDREYLFRWLECLSHSVRLLKAFSQTRMAAAPNP